ncbi:MAG: GGDEF-domain containing protein, partial [Actinoplanes sp.]
MSPLVNSLCVVALGAGTIWACFAGPRRHGAQPRRVWLLIGASALCFLVGVMLRPLVEDTPLVADAATIPGYLLLTAFLGRLLRSRQSLERHAVLDGLIVCLAAGLAAVLLFGLPAAEITDRPRAESMIAGLYPIFDVVLLLLLVNLTFTVRAWPVSLAAFTVCLVMMLVGDTAYAFIGTSGHTYTSPLLDAPYLVSYTMLGVTTL